MASRSRMDILLSEVVGSGNNCRQVHQAETHPSDDAEEHVFKKSLSFFEHL